MCAASWLPSPAPSTNYLHLGPPLATRPSLLAVDGQGFLRQYLPHTLCSSNTAGGQDSPLPQRAFPADPAITKEPDGQPTVWFAVGRCPVWVQCLEWPQGKPKAQLAHRLGAEEASRATATPRQTRATAVLLSDGNQQIPLFLFSWFCFTQSFPALLRYD